MASRQYVAGLLRNTPENMVRWLRFPQKWFLATPCPIWACRITTHTDRSLSCDAEMRGRHVPGSDFRQWRRHARKRSSLAGMLALAALWLGPLPSLSQTTFSPHMMLHLGVVVVAAPLIASALRSISANDKFRHCVVVVPARPLVRDGGRLGLARSAAARSSGAQYEPLHPRAGVNSSCWPCSLDLGVHGAKPQDSARGGNRVVPYFHAYDDVWLILTLAPILLYDPDLCHGAFGLDRLQDQHLGGVLMAVGGGLPYLIGTGWAVSNVLAEKDS